ncbi:hypothetical protein BS47DRAFT_1372502 [Hydnum rufescens UP504]|uniref:C2H2-type domain-containing protein n=1 Tax=Hydnum rufescens UP504 TaxID=1448309 RepID=A0A9P6AXA9_9AGAM|nr:hypothetical protein BS47DRAFT_1372502 [Hydnum rufescens UP504]
MTYCDRCNAHFYTSYARHLQISENHYVCQDCDIDFPAWHRLESHYIQSPRHHYCQYCNEHFDDKFDHEEHNDDRHWWCRPCNAFFNRGGEVGLREHNRQTHADRWCIPCKRLFASPSNLFAHQRSATHVKADIKCPMRGCGLTFVSVSAMTLHLEQGACVSGINRSIVNSRIVALDRNNVITNPARLIGGPAGTPTVAQSTTYRATERSYNGRAYECYLCNKEFNTLPALNAHLNSPRHQDKIYRCPKSNCRKEFST